MSKPKKVGFDIFKKLEEKRKELGIENTNELEHKTSCTQEEQDDYASRKLAEASAEELKKIPDRKINDYIALTENQKRARQMAVKYALNPVGSIAFFGRPGTGKTHLAVAIMRKLAGDKIFVKYAQYNTLVRELSNSRFDNINQIKTWNKYLKPKYLLLDDLFKAAIKKDYYGSEQIDYQEFKLIFELVNARYLKKKCTIITCEYDMDKLLELDEAFASRIYELCDNKVIEFTKEDKNYRLERT